MNNPVKIARVVAVIGSDDRPTTDINYIAEKANSIIDVVISLGAEDGVLPDMKFVVYEAGEELFDPNTKVSLGQFEIVKGRGKATHVQEKMTVIRSTSTKRVLKNDIFGSITRNNTGDPEFRIVTAPFSGVKIGDLVKPI